MDSASIPLIGNQATIAIDKAGAIKEAFTHSWDGYVKYAFGKDELRPLSNTGSNSRYFGFPTSRAFYRTSTNFGPFQKRMGRIHCGRFNYSYHNAA